MRALLKIFKSEFEFLLRRASRKDGSTGLLNNFYRMIGSASICFNFAGSILSAFLNKFIKFYYRFGSSDPRASANYWSNSSSSSIGAKFFKFIFLLFSIFSVIISEFFDLFLKRFSIALIERSLATRVKLSGFNVEFSPNILFNNSLFSKFSPPIFFKAFKGESFPLRLASLSKVLSFYGSIPLSSLNKFLVNSFVYLLF